MIIIFLLKKSLFIDLIKKVSGDSNDLKQTAIEIF